MPADLVRQIAWVPVERSVCWLPASLRTVARLCSATSAAVVRCLALVVEADLVSSQVRALHGVAGFDAVAVASRGLVFRAPDGR